MTPSLPPELANALSRVRAGDLAGATGLIRSLLGAAPARSPIAPAAAGPVTIHGTARRIPGDAAPRTATAPTGRFIEARYDGGDGVLDYRLYIPASAGAAMPLVVMLHGCTQTPEDFARGTGMNAIADELGLLVAYPRQPQSANAQKCWNWFRSDDQRRGRGEPALIAGATRQIIADHAADPARVYVAGLSAGGAAAAIMAAAYPDLYAAVGIHSGLACGIARDLPSALAAMRTGSAPAARAAEPFVPVITFHGDRDTTVNEGNSRTIVRRAEAASAASLTTTIVAGESHGGRRHSRAIAADADGRVVIEQWTLHGAGHAWSGGAAGASYVDPGGPDASREMVRFFLTHRLPSPSRQGSPGR